MANRRQRQSSRARAVALFAVPLVSCAGWIAAASAQQPPAGAAAYQMAYSDLNLSAPYNAGAPFTGTPAPAMRPVFRMSAVDWQPRTPVVERTPPTNYAPAPPVEGEPIPPAGALLPSQINVPPVATALVDPAETPREARRIITSGGTSHGPSASRSAAPTPAAPTPAGPTPAAPVNPITAANTPTLAAPAPTAPTPAAPAVPTPAAPTAAAASAPSAASPLSAPAAYASPPAPAYAPPPAQAMSAQAMSVDPNSAPRVTGLPGPVAVEPEPVDPAYTQTAPGVVRRIGRPTPADPTFQGWNVAQSPPPVDVAMRQDRPISGPPPAGPDPMVTGGEGIVAPLPHGEDDDERGYWHVGQSHFDPRCKNPNLLSPEERTWFTRGDFLYWKREGGTPQNIAFNDATNAVVLNTGTLNFEYQQGVRLTVGKIVDPKSSVEFTMFNILRQTESQSAFSDTDDLVSFFAVGAGPGFVVDAFDFASRQTIEYSSDLWNFESNYLRDVAAPYNLRAHWLVGFRSMMLFENFDFRSIDLGLAQMGEYHIKTQDYLFGPQLGGAVEYPLGDGWWVTLRGKTGLLLNQVHQKSQITADSIEVFANEGNKWTASAMLDLGLLTRIELSDRAEIHLGYEALFLSGVGLAPEQTDFSTSLNSQRSVDAQSSVFYHGITAGSTIRW